MIIKTPCNSVTSVVDSYSLFPVAIYTLGCKLNQLESEAIAGSFKKAGFPIVPWDAPMRDPGLFIINTCTVTSKAEQKARRVIRRVLRDNPQSCVIVAGCYAQLDAGDIASLAAPESGPRRLFVLGNSPDGEGGAGAAKSPLLDLPGYLKEFYHGVSRSNTEEEERGRSNTPCSSVYSVVESWVESAQKGEAPCLPFNFKPDDFTFHSRGYLKIQDGCDGHCSYCRTRLARGSSVSLPPQDALAQLLSLEDKGCAELMLTGINITQYHHDGFDLAGLLEYLLQGSKTIALRLSSLEPENITEKLAAVLAHPRIRPHFHLSVQSGSGAILGRMGRAYTPQTVENAAALLRSVKDNPFLACDIIAGFPGETDADFADTLALCEKIRFAWIHAFPYSPRPGTQAFHFDNPVCERAVSERMALLTNLALEGRRDYAQQWIGRELSAITEKGPVREAGRCRAVSENYLKLLVACPGATPPSGAPLRCVPTAPGGNDYDLSAQAL